MFSDVISSRPPIRRPLAGRSSTCADTIGAPVFPRDDERAIVSFRDPRRRS
jgi:hypothetical protein